MAGNRSTAAWTEENSEQNDESMFGMSERKESAKRRRRVEKRATEANHRNSTVDMLLWVPRKSRAFSNFSFNEKVSSKLPGMLIWFSRVLLLHELPWCCLLVCSLPRCCGRNPNNFFNHTQNACMKFQILNHLSKLDETFRCWFSLFILLVVPIALLRCCPRTSNYCQLYQLAQKHPLFWSDMKKITAAAEADENENDKKIGEKEKYLKKIHIL